MRKNKADGMAGIKEIGVAVVLIAAMCLTGCSSRKADGQETQPSVSAETVPVQETENTAAVQTAPEQEAFTEVLEPTESLPSSEETSTVEDGDNGRIVTSDQIVVDGYTYHTETLEKSWLADTGQVACEVKLSGPFFEGGSDAETAINTFYEEWRSDMLAGYEDNPESIVKNALEIKNDPEYADSPGSEEIFTLEKVLVREKAISIYQSSYTYEGGAHGMPGRENHLFDRTTGKEITLETLTGLTTEALNEKMRGMFLQLVNDDTENMFFPEAADTLAQKEDYTQNYYLGEEGVVFYMQPYEIAPYAAGFIEITIPYEELGID